MDRLGWWAFLYCICNSLYDSKVQSQCLYDGGKNGPTSTDLFVEISNELSNPTLTAKNQLMNTLLTVAASKGVLPELASALQPSLSADAVGSSSVPKSSTVLPVSGNSPIGIGQDFATVKVISGSTPSNPIQGFLQIPVNPELFQGIPQPSPGFPVENYFYSTDCPTSQIESSNDMFKYFSTIPESDFSPESFKTALSFINNAENSGSDTTFPTYKQPIVVTSESENIPPFNIEINVPIPQIPDQIATLFNEQSVAGTNFNLGTGDMPLPIVISNSKSTSSLKKILPLMLLAMLLDDNDGCCGSCRCDAEPNYIPVPYPFPIPIAFKSKYDSIENDSSEEFVFC